jgi:hypothetical protein
MGLREAVKEANRHIFADRLMVCVKDEGQLSCHKIKVGIQ